MPIRSIFPMAQLRKLVALCFIFAASIAVAAEPAMSAQFSQGVTGVGEPVQLQIKVSGARSVSQPPDVQVDGLRVSYLGPSQNTSMRIENGRMVSETSVTYIYQVEPTRTGDFTVPALAMSVDGQMLQTQPVSLKVEQTSRPRGTGEELARGTLEIVLPKKTAYVGETLPVEIRISVDAQIHWQLEAMPEILGEGFTKQKLPEPKQEHGTRNGRDTDVLVFRTAITPGRAGKLTLGPVEIPYIAQVPRAQRNRQRSFFDDVFGDPFFAVNQRFKARAEAIELEVKPLPAAGRPANFSGAVGEFKLTASGSPNRVKVGDPITMKLAVRGRGNFDRIEAPALLDPAGWRSYPASSEFKADDALNTAGTKTFSMAVIPEAKKTAMPAFEFSYFDPTTERYVTLASEPESLIVEGAPLPPPVVAAPAETKDEPAATPAPAADIVGIRYDVGGRRHSFQPIYRQQGFLVAQAVPLAALLGFLVGKLRRNDGEMQRVAAAKRKATELFTSLRGRELANQEFLEIAAQVIQWETSLATGRPAGSIDAAVACASRRLEAETTEGVERIFNTRGELLYAGMGGGSGSLSADERRNVLMTLEKFREAKARA